MKSFGYYVYATKASDRELDRTTFTAMYYSELMIKLAGDLKFNNLTQSIKVEQFVLNRHIPVLATSASVLADAARANGPFDITINRMMLSPVVAFEAAIFMTLQSYFTLKTAYRIIYSN